MEKIKKILLLFCFIGIAGSVAKAQSTKTTVTHHQLSFQVDNDALAFTHFDRYYTNGLFLGYAYSRDDQNRIKLTLAQQIFTPERYTSDDIQTYDRPYAGVLYGKFDYQRLSARGWWQGGLLLGKIGPGSKAEDLQVWYHQLFGFPQPRGWQYQIENSALMNVDVQAGWNAVKGRRVDFWLFSRASVGNFDRSISLSPALRFGSYLPGSQGMISGNRLGSSTKREIYGQLGAEYKRVFWNATLQGTGKGDYNNPNLMVPVALRQEYYAEFVYSVQRIGIKYRFSYRTRETQQAEGQLLGRLSFGYAF
ncbi:exonuclease [Echinicola pacifica]|uniref:Exonuclease n=1 Tax=Echinicola pacifica TaxID=346377 RepID=A0A918Q9X2_9BACT|nr:lipid A deacylase LpxR family protein [Echinicola pacifica]GGZ36113.1 exonuclease [Echinicola pacifica]